MEEILRQAERLEKKYSWLGATESYEEALRLLSEDDLSRKGDISERLGYAFYRAAFQAENNDEFRERMHQAILNYRKAKTSYERSNAQAREPRSLRCDAMIAFASYWLASKASVKKRLLDKCWSLAKEALKGLDKTDRAREYGETYNHLSSSPDHRFSLESNFQLRKELVKDAVKYGECAIALLSKVNASDELARAYVKTALYLSVFAWYFASEMDEKEDCFKKGLGYWQKAGELSEEAAFLELLSINRDTLDWNIDEMLVQFGKALGYARKTEDKQLVGTALEWLKYAIGWTRPSIEDPDKLREVTEKTLQYAKDVAREFSTISFVSQFPIHWSGAPYAEYYWYLARWEVDLRKRRDLLEKAVVDWVAAVKRAESVGYPDVVMATHGMLGRGLVFLAKTETNAEEKRKLLESAGGHLRESLKLRESLERFNYWNLGTSWADLANLETELSQNETDDEKKKIMLEEAVLHQERGLQFCVKHTFYLEKKGKPISTIGELAQKQYVYGEMLDLLYGLTHNDDVQRKALEAFKDSAESFQKLNLVSRVAESCWKVARSYDALGEHLKAAENFDLASDNYKRAAEKTSQLKSFYEDHASYTQAWSEIETARDEHKGQEYGSAKKHFEKAADLHKSLKHWSYLAPNYAAWAELEDAEELSRDDRDEEAKKSFERAARLFSETRRSIRSQFHKIEDADEKLMATNMLEATDTRHEYCDARSAIEEAKILDKKGDHYSSSKKYGLAAEAFKRISQRQESDQEKREIQFITILSTAWQKTTLAEAEASPTLYAEASELFEQIRECAPNEKTKMLVLGHSRFCKALETGTRFADSRDPTLHQIAEQHLESAANYYVKAGFQNASEYSKAMEHLFDAYLYMDDAKKEKDPEKKARLYTMAEKVLQTSAGSFMKAEHPEKTEQVSRLLDKTREEKELALSLSEVLHAPSIVSATSAFTAPTPTHENAVGLERFQYADVQANLIVRQRELKVGENLRLEIELVNAGKGPALLIKVNEAIPEGFEFVEKQQDIYRVEDSYINLRGKRLDPLKTEEVRLILKPKVQGKFTLKPTILYLDENGKYKSYEPESMNIIVKELGIKGWIKGER